MIEVALQKKLSASMGEMLLEVAFKIEKGSLVTLYGKSGAGKTSILRMLAGLLRPDEGRIWVNGTVWYDAKQKICLKPQKRKVGLLFQDYALFPNMTVRGNLEFALEKGQDRKTVSEIIEVMELGELQLRKPQTLSGGQKQRVALARALVHLPEILMLDEPLSALDAEMRQKLQDYILKVHREYQLTTILVSHDLSEILKMSNQVLVLEQGLITHKGTPAEVLGNGSSQKGYYGEVVSVQGDQLAVAIKGTGERELPQIGEEIYLEPRSGRD
jgi:molybdate transport system ATP-binding protein